MIEFDLKFLLAVLNWAAVAGDGDVDFTEEELRAVLSHVEPFGEGGGTPPGLAGEIRHFQMGLRRALGDKDAH